MSQTHIEHEGTITAVSEREITVSIENHSACAACHAKGACNLSGSKQKEIRVEKPDRPVTLGEQVIIVGSTGNAYFSVVLAYVIPSLLIIGMLVLLSNGTEELIAATGSLAVVSVYFFILYLNRNRLARKIKFRLKQS